MHSSTWADRPKLERATRARLARLLCSRRIITASASAVIRVPYPSRSSFTRHTTTCVPAAPCVCVYAPRAPGLPSELVTDLAPGDGIGSFSHERISHGNRSREIVRSPSRVDLARTVPNFFFFFSSILYLHLRDVAMRDPFSGLYPLRIARIETNRPSVSPVDRTRARFSGRISAKRVRLGEARERDGESLDISRINKRCDYRARRFLRRNAQAG